MRILHVLSQFEVTGAETFAVTLMDEQLRRGHWVGVVSDTLQTSTKARYWAQPMGRRRPWNRVRNVLFLRRLIREQKIDVVHAHSRAASWVAAVAIKGLPVAFVSTVHGRQHIHRSSQTFDIYGQYVMAVCENLARHLQDELFLNPAKIVVIPNAVEFAAPQSSPTWSAGELCRITLVARATGPKGQRAVDFAEQILPHIPHVHLQIVGASLEEFPSELRSRLERLQTQAGERVCVLGFSRDLPSVLQKSHLVVAAGRSAMQAAALNIPVLAMGEGLSHGLVTEQNLAAVYASNWGDCVVRQADVQFDWEQIRRAVKDFLQNPQVSMLGSAVRQRYQVGAVVDQVQDIYERARMQRLCPRPIPVLMYHKVPDQELQSRHKTFVRKDIFARQMRILKKRGYQSLTFQDYDAFRTEQKPATEFPKKPVILTFDDGYRDNLQNAVPILQQNGFRAVFYLLGDASVDHNTWDTQEGDPRADLLQPQERQQLVAAGMEVGAHAMSHRDLTRLPASEMHQEIVQCREALEKELGQTIVSFAYPYGRYTPEVKAAVRASGFRFAVATDRGGLHLEEDPFEIFRVNMFPRDLGFRFWKKTSWWYRLWYRYQRGI